MKLIINIASDGETNLPGVYKTRIDVPFLGTPEAVSSYKKLVKSNIDRLIDNSIDSVWRDQNRYTKISKFCIIGDKGEKACIDNTIKK